LGQEDWEEGKVCSEREVEAVLELVRRIRQVFFPLLP